MCCVHTDGFDINERLLRLLEIDNIVHNIDVPSLLALVDSDQVPVLIVVEDQGETLSELLLHARLRVELVDLQLVAELTIDDRLGEAVTDRQVELGQFGADVSHLASEVAEGNEGAGGGRASF